MQIIYISIFSFLAHVVCAQSLHYVSSYYADDLSDWRIYNEEAQEIGVISTRWSFENNIKEWNVSFNGVSGMIRQKWNNTPDQWEIRFGNSVYIASPSWPNQYDRWRISNNDDQYVLNWVRDPEGVRWEVEKDGQIIFSFYNEYYGEILDWIAWQSTTKMDPDLELICIFVPLYYSIIKKYQ
ncbi:MAG: hypothetical protein M3Q56_01660 [Bacteroidota bacterium]|nr:hypothetical protein [Bacteroidota bacterium]